MRKIVPWLGIVLIGLVCLFGVWGEVNAIKDVYHAGTTGTMIVNECHASTSHSFRTGSGMDCTGTWSQGGHDPLVHHAVISGDYNVNDMLSANIESVNSNGTLVLTTQAQRITSLIVWALVMWSTMFVGTVLVRSQLRKEK